MHKRSTMTQDSDPFLVWLPGQPDLAPRIQGPLFTGRAGLNHSVWGGPGLELVSLGPPHSGRYTCRLTSHAGRAEAWADMLVFSPHSELEFQQRRLSGGAGVRLSCRVAGTFPRPELRLTRGTETLQPDSATTTSTDRFAFSARVDKVGGVERAAMHWTDLYLHQVVPAAELRAGTPFGCEVRLVGTDYVARQEAASCSCRLLRIKDRARRVRVRQRRSLAAKRNILL